MRDTLLETRLAVLSRDLMLTRDICTWEKTELRPEKYKVKEQDWNSAFGEVYKNAERVGYQVEDLGATLNEAAEKPDDDAEAILTEAWGDYRRLRDDGAATCRDCLELVGGFALRDNLQQYHDDRVLEKRVCLVAEAIIDVCKGASRDLQAMLAIPALESGGASTVARIVRARLPEWTLWALPFAAYEYGRAVLDQINVLKIAIEEEDRFRGVPAVEQKVADVEQRIEDAREHRATGEGQDPDAREHELAQLKEEVRRLERERDQLRDGVRMLFADAFATRIMGPAYACAAAVLRFDPFRPDPSAGVSDIERAEVLFRVLERTYPEEQVEPGDEPTTAPYDLIHDHVEDRWNAAVERARTAHVPMDEQSPDVLRERGRAFVERHWKAIRRGVSPDVQYDYGNSFRRGCWKAARNLVKVWEDKQMDDPRYVPEFRDVLNAAWRCRILETFDLEQLNRLAREKCDELNELLEAEADRAGPDADSLTLTGLSRAQQPEHAS